MRRQQAVTLAPVAFETKYDELLSNFRINFNFRRYMVGRAHSNVFNKEMVLDAHTTLRGVPAGAFTRPLLTSS
jgi:hypothetical protein